MCFEKTMGEIHVWNQPIASNAPRANGVKPSIYRFAIDWAIFGRNTLIFLGNMNPQFSNRQPRNTPNGSYLGTVYFLGFQLGNLQGIILTNWGIPNYSTTLAIRNWESYRLQGNKHISQTCLFVGNTKAPPIPQQIIPQYSPCVISNSGIITPIYNSSHELYNPFAVIQCYSMMANAT